MRRALLALTVGLLLAGCTTWGQLSWQERCYVASTLGTATMEEAVTWLASEQRRSEVCGLTQPPEAAAACLAGLSTPTERNRVRDSVGHMATALTVAEPICRQNQAGTEGQAEQLRIVRAALLEALRTAQMIPPGGAP